MIPRDPAVLARAAEVRALRGLSSSDALAGAPLTDVLLYGLLTRPDEDPVQGIIDGARLFLDVLIGYVEGNKVEPDLVQKALHVLGERLDVAGEVLFRLRRAERAEERAADAEKDGAP